MKQIANPTGRHTQGLFPPLAASHHQEHGPAPDTQCALQPCGVLLHKAEMGIVRLAQSTVARTDRCNGAESIWGVAKNAIMINS